MERTKRYIAELLGKEIGIVPVRGKELSVLPYHAINAFNFYRTRFYGINLLLVEVKGTGFQVGQLKKQLALIGKVFNEKLVLIADTMDPMSKRRLMESGIQFIIPGKQLFMPGLLIDIKEDLPQKGYLRQVNKLPPSAQCILLYKLLNPYEKIEQLTFKELARKLGYTAMAITKAIATLEKMELCKVKGTKEKHIHFEESRQGLWKEARPYLINPVLKKVYVDQLPETGLLQSNLSALAEYTNMTPGNQKFYAIEKSIFYTFQKNRALIKPNEYEGAYCLEVWKYNPDILAKGVTEENNVDPLSLYLSLTDVQDERVEMALDQIVEKFIW